MTLFNNKIKVIIINICISLLFIEVFSIVAYAYKREEFFYTRDISIYAEKAEKGAFAGNFFKTLNLAIHPYFGWVERVKRGATNNHGFRNVSAKDDCCDFPFKAKENQAIVAIFGGSVAGALGIMSRGDDYFRKKLKNLPQFADKEIVFLTFASGGYRQPQQVMILTYYLLIGQKFDVIINVDGFNEIVTAFNNNNDKDNIDISLPATDIWFNTGRHIERINMRSGDNRGIVLAQHVWQDVNLARSSEQCMFATCFIIRKMLQHYHRLQIENIDGEKNEKWREYTHFYLPLKHKQPENGLTFKTIPAMMKKQAQIWENSARRMAQMAKNSNAQYIHMLQPTLLYVVDKKIEPRNRLNPYDRYIPILKEGYPRLISKIPAMRADGINIADGTGIFDSYQGRIYSDDCCHYNMAGMQIMVDRIVDQIRATPRLRP